MVLKFHFCRKVRGFKLSGLLIRFFQKTPFSHVAIEISGDGYHDEPMIFESVIPMSKRLPLKVWSQEHYEPVLTYTFKIPDHKKSMEIFSELYAGIDRKYSTFQILLIGVAMVFPKVHRIFGQKNWNGRYFLHCSEYGARIGRVIGMKFDEEADTIDLRELQDACEKLKELGVYNA